MEGWRLIYLGAPNHQHIYLNKYSNKYYNCNACGIPYSEYVHVTHEHPGINIKDPSLH